jgi:hypothetical protein
MKKTKAELQNDIEYLLCNFNFEKVLIAMQALDWKWRMADDTLAIPTIVQLEQKARYLCNQVINQKIKEIGTGGFVVRRRKSGLQLSFEVAWYDSFDIIPDRCLKND